MNINIPKLQLLLGMIRNIGGVANSRKKFTFFEVPPPPLDLHELLVLTAGDSPHRIQLLE